MSRSNKKVLHVDCNDYYGGADAALTLQEAEEWAGKVNALDDLQFSAASIVKPDSSLGTAKLGPPRAYSLCLSPHIVYSQSRLVPALISSQVYRQLEFQAVGSWWIYRPTKFDVVGDNEAPGTGTGSFQRVPSSREDVFADNSMGMKAKRALMKFLRFISTYSQDSDEDSIDPDSNFTSFLLSKFQVPLELHDPLLALSLSQESAQDTDAHTAVFRIQTHFRSIGVFGPGFGAVIPKWGGSAEIAQVACRAGAVGGSVYVLNRGVQAIAQSSSADNEVTEINPLIKVVLSDGEEINTRWIVGSRQDLPQTYSEDTGAQTSRSISVVSSELDHLFPQTAENGPIPAVAVVSFDGVALGLSSDASPVHLLVHSSDTGECPSGQCKQNLPISYPKSLCNDDSIQSNLSTLSAILLKRTFNLIANLEYHSCYKLAGNEWPC